MVAQVFIGGMGSLGRRLRVYVRRMMPGVWDVSERLGGWMKGVRRVRSLVKSSGSKLCGLAGVFDLWKKNTSSVRDSEVSAILWTIQESAVPCLGKAQSCCVSRNQGETYVLWARSDLPFGFWTAHAIPRINCVR